MEGRDTGSPAYQRAAEYVAERFKQAGLQPAGENGTFFQTVPMHEVRLQPDSTVQLKGSSGATRHLRLMYDLYPTGIQDAPSAVSGTLSLRGACAASDLKEVRGKVILCLGGQHAAPDRAANARAGGAAGLLTVDDPYYTLEPVRWPFPYARSVTLRSGNAAPPPATPIFTALLNADTFRQLLQYTGHYGEALLKAAAANQPLPSFDLPWSLTATLHTAERDIASPNVLAILPGTAPTLKDEHLALSAHLDGYGYGEAVNGDSLYNGALDDAAYVSLLIQLADDLHRSGGSGGDTLQRPKRSLLFCVFTGEEKGLLGARWFVDHTTVPRSAIVADVNLDQLRPLFPLHTLTALAIHDTTLGTTAQQVGTTMGITVREDREPQRGLLRRADHYPFLQAGIPAIGFIFGFEPGTDEERRYREWYRVRYHRPQDDLTQPLDFDAARMFNQFFYRFTLALADRKDRPHIMPGSPFLKP